MRIYTSGVFDLFHVGHLHALRTAKSMGDYLLVGIHNDLETQAYKRLPVIPFVQRWEIVEALGIADEIMQCPVRLPADFYIQHRIDIHCQGDDVSDTYASAKQLGIMHFFGRDQRTDTTEIMNKIVGYLDQRDCNG